MTDNQMNRRLHAYLLARSISAGVATIVFAIWAFVEELAPAWWLVVAATLFTASSLAQLRRPFRTPGLAAALDLVIVFGGVYASRPFPGAEATALALVLTSTIVFGTGISLRWTLPALATVAAVAGAVNWIVREPPGWSETGMLVNAAVGITAVIPIIWMAGFVARTSGGGLIALPVVADPGSFANAVTETVSEGIAVIDLDSTIRYANPAFCEMFGYTPSDLIGGSLSQVMDADTYRRHSLAVRGGLRSARVIDSRNMELVGRHRLGHPITVLASVSELEGTGERLVLGAVRDVTEMVELRARLEELVAAKDRFLAAVSHELRTPLTAVVAFSEMLAGDEVALGESERKEYVDLIADQSREMSYLVEDLLVAARLESDSVSIAPRSTNLRAEVVSATGPWAARRSLEIHHDSLDVSVHTDPGRLRQIVRNLVSNAIKYGGDHITIRAEPDGQSACRLVVSDNGEGVPPSMERSMFEPYEGAGDVEGAPPSMGLGLYVSRSLAEVMGGSLGYRRLDGRTEFVLAMPSHAS